jgi:hypothetical protein
MLEDHCLLESFHGDVLSPSSGCFHGIPENSGLLILIVSLYGEAKKQRFHGNTTVKTYQFKEP